MQQGKFHCDKCGAIHYSFYDFHGHEHVGCLVGGGHWVSERRHLTKRAVDLRRLWRKMIVSRVAQATNANH